MSQIWWCVHISHSLILFFSHFSKWNAGVNIHERAVMQLMPWICGLNSFNRLKSTSSDSPWLWGICSVHVLLLLCIVLHRSLLDVWCGILFLTRFYDSLLDVMQTLLCDVLVAMIFHVVFWDPIVVCWWDPHIVIMHVCIEIPIMPCWQDAHHAWVCVILIGVFSTESSYSGTSLGTTPAWGNFPYMIATSSLMYIISYVHHHYWHHLMQQPKPSWHQGRET